MSVAPAPMYFPGRARPRRATPPDDERCALLGLDRDPAPLQELIALVARRLDALARGGERHVDAAAFGDREAAGRMAVDEGVDAVEATRREAHLAAGLVECDRQRTERLLAQQRDAAQQKVAVARGQVVARHRVGHSGDADVLDRQPLARAGAGG